MKVRFIFFIRYIGVSDKKASVINVDDISEVRETLHRCPLCNSPLVLRNTKHGHILGCSNYPICNYIENVVVQGVTVVRSLENSFCPECGSALAVKKSRYGMFIGCTAYPNCNYIYSEKTGSFINCPICGEGVLKQNLNKYGKSFYYCTNFKNCSFKINHRPIESKCPKCGFPLLVVRTGKNGKYLQCPIRTCKCKTIYNPEIDN